MSQSKKNNSPSYVREYSSSKYNEGGSIKKSREESNIDLKDNKSTSQYAFYPYEPIRRTYSPLRDTVKKKKMEFIYLFFQIDFKNIYYCKIINRKNIAERKRI